MRDFSLLSDIVPEDKELRQKLQRERLDQVLKIHQQDNSNDNFSRICLFCKQVYTQHSKLFDHMAFDHNFSVGQPANLVFVNKETWVSICTKYILMLIGFLCNFYSNL